MAALAPLPVAAVTANTLPYFISGLPPSFDITRDLGEATTPHTKLNRQLLVAALIFYTLPKLQELFAQGNSEVQFSHHAQSKQHAVRCIEKDDLVSALAHILAALELRNATPPPLKGILSYQTIAKVAEYLDTQGFFVSSTRWISRKTNIPININIYHPDSKPENLAFCFCLLDREGKPHPFESIIHIINFDLRCARDKVKQA